MEKNKDNKILTRVERNDKIAVSYIKYRMRRLNNPVLTQPSVKVRDGSETSGLKGLRWHDPR